MILRDQVTLHFSEPFVLFTKTVDGHALIVIGCGIALGWLLVLITHGRNVFQNNPRFGCCIGDLGLLAPACIISGVGLLTNRPWGAPLLLIAVGAAAFDLTHTFSYLAEIGWPQPGESRCRRGSLRSRFSSC